jgi:hypothetical protein
MRRQERLVKIETVLRIFEQVAEPVYQQIENVRRPEYVYNFTAFAPDTPQIVDPHDMIGMLVRIEHCIDALNSGSEKLCTEIRRRIDKNPKPVFFHDNRGARPVVPWIFRVALPPVAGNQRDAARRTAAEYGYFH